MEYVIRIRPKNRLIHSWFAIRTSNKPKGMPASAAIDSFFRTIGSLYFQAEDAKNKATVKPTRPINATADEKGMEVMQAMAC